MSESVSESPALGTITPVVKINDEFRYEEKVLYLRVEDEVYRVHSYLLTRDSAFFRDMIEIPAPSGNNEGLCPEFPISLPDVTKKDFRALLNVLYQPIHTLANDSISPQEWVAILSLADTWEMKSTGAFAAQHLSTRLVDPFEKFSLSRQFQLVESWWMPAFTEICNLERHVTQDEWERLDGKEIQVIAAARERLLKERTMQKAKVISKSKGRLRITCWMCDGGSEGEDTACPTHVIQESAKSLGRTL